MGDGRSARRDSHRSGATLGSACSRCSQDPNLPEPGAPQDTSEEEGASTQHPKSPRAGVGVEHRVPQGCPFTDRGTPRFQGGPGFAQSQLEARPADARYLGASLHKCQGPMAPGPIASTIIKELTVCQGDSGENKPGPALGVHFGRKSHIS